MSTPLPVPSKAALRALRGIALGTSCALGAIVEDRRRRIHTLRTAVSNKEKLRSSRQYHGSYDAVSVQLDDSVNLTPDELLWYKSREPALDSRGSQTRSSPSQQKPRQEEVRHLCDAADRPNYSRGTHSSRPAPLPPVIRSPPASPPSKQPVQATPAAIRSRGEPSPLNGRTPWTLPNSSNSKRSKTTPEDAIAEVTDILASGDEERWRRALDKALNVYDTYTTKQLTDEWFSFSASFSRQSQAHGQWEIAQRILVAFVRKGPSDESHYVAHDPLPIIQHTLRQGDESTPCSPETLALASELFLAPFKERPHSRIAGVEPVGLELINQALFWKEFGLAKDAYSRVLCQLENAAAFTGRAIEAFSKVDAHKNVISFFLLHFSKTEPEGPRFHTTLDIVIRSVDAMDGFKTEPVIRALARIKCPGDGDLRSGCIIKLLQAHWRRHRELAKSQALFEEISSLGLLDKIDYPGAVYRAMVEISVKAEDRVATQAYYEELVHKYPNMRYDIPLQGFLALASAKVNDWDSVRDAFVSMRSQIPKGQAKENTYDDAFVMVLKVFAASHPVEEVRLFLTEYIEDLGVHMHRYVVTLLANKYGQCHDVPGFLSWLEYCSKAGFALDPGFCNSILYNCSTKWKLSYEELRQIYLEVRLLNPSSSDEVTQRIMSQAALAGGKTIRRRPGIPFGRPKVIAVDRLAYLGRSTNSRDIYETMNQAYGSGRFNAAVSIYRRALRYGMSHCPHCLRLAVAACMQQSQDGSGPAVMLIHDAHQRGHDVTSALSNFIKMKIERFAGRAEDLMVHLQNLIDKFEAMNMVIDPAAMTQMADACIQANQYDKAISLCILAKNKNGTGNLCFSRRSFRVLLTAYSKILDLRGVRELMDDLFVSEFSADKSILAYLRSVRRFMNKMERNSIVSSILEIFDHAINTVRQARAEYRAQGRFIAQETLQIMGNALNDMQSGASPRQWETPVKPEEPEAVGTNEDSSRVANAA